MLLRWTANFHLSALAPHWALSLAVLPQGWPPRIHLYTSAAWLNVLATQIPGRAGHAPVRRSVDDDRTTGAPRQRGDHEFTPSSKSGRF
jgi:hypothetical protein